MTTNAGRAPNAEQLLAAGIEAVRAGRLTEGQALLARAVRADPRLEAGWWEMAKIVPDPAQREYCLRRVLALNPANASARRMLASVAAEGSAPPAAAVPPARPAATAPLRSRPAPPPAAPTAAPSPWTFEPSPTAAPAPAPSARPAAAAPPPAPPIPPSRALAIPAGSTAQAEAPAQPAPRGRPALWLLGLAALVLVVIVVALAARGLGLAANILPGAPSATASVAAPIAHTAAATAQQLFPTLPPAWTPTRGPATPTASAAPSATPAARFEARLAAAQAAIAQARQQSDSQAYAQAIASWTAVLAQVPEYAAAYEQRAQASIALGRQQPALDDYRAHFQSALADLNQASSLDPANAALLLRRAYVLDRLGTLELDRVSQNPWYELALANSRQAVALGGGAPAQHMEAIELLALGQCAAARDEITLLLNSAPSPALFSTLAMTNACLDQYNNALAAIEQALAGDPSSDNQMTHANILYNLGRLDEARAAIDALGAADPRYCGCRLYLRALIDYNQGQPERAAQDVEKGDGLTWDRGGIRSYVLGHLSLDAGRQADGITFLQEAEASLPPDQVPLHTLVLSELSALGAAPLAPAVSITPTPTLLPITPQPQPPTETPVVTAAAAP